MLDGARSTESTRALEQSTRGIEVWLWLVAALIAVLVVVGGITRLTGSGLSITEWRPVTGIVPPLSQGDWHSLFEKYQASPQFLLENRHLDLDGFKAIFWWEWIHRFIARLLGVVVLIPLIAFFRRRSLEPWLGRRLALLLILGSVQGLLGWLMVASGLVDVPRVSHLRLAAHLMMAYVVLGLTIWTALEVRHGREGTRGQHLSSMLGSSALPVGVFLAVLGLQIVFGAFVAGLRAGYLYPTFPRMGNEWLPGDLSFDSVTSAKEFLGLFVGNGLLVQFVHRWLGALVLVLGLGVAVHGFLRSLRARWVFVVLAVGVTGQFVFGIFTMLGFYMDPVWFGATHQLGATMLLGITTMTLFFAHRDRGHARVAIRREHSALPALRQLGP